MYLVTVYPTTGLQKHEEVSGINGLHLQVNFHVKYFIFQITASKSSVISAFIHNTIYILNLRSSLKKNLNYKNKE